MRATTGVAMVVSGASMNDSEFLSLNPLAAQRAIGAVADQAERARLRQLYARSRGLSGPEPQKTAAPAKSARRRLLDGRLNRAQFWATLITLMAVNVFCQTVLHLRLGATQGVLLTFCIPRLHDTGRTGWIAGGVLIAEVVAMFAAICFLHGAAAHLALAGLVLGLFGLLILLGAMPGDPSENRYGPPPPPGFGFRKPADLATQTAATFD